MKPFLPHVQLHGAHRPGEIAKWTRGGELRLASVVRAGDGTHWLEVANDGRGADAVRFLKNLDQRWQGLDSVYHEPRFRRENVEEVVDLEEVSPNGLVGAVAHLLRA
jgi:hypothetical protein